MSPEPAPAQMARGVGAPHPDGGGSVLSELLTARQIAEVLQMRVSTVEEYARRGVLPSIKLGRHRRFVRSQVERLVLDQLEVQATPGRRSIARRR